jgi:hypothetical protein
MLRESSPKENEMTTIRRISLDVLFLVVIVFAGKNALAGCEKDTDCKADRVCFKGECMTAEGAAAAEKAILPPAPAPVITSVTAPTGAPLSSQLMIHLSTEPLGAKAALDNHGGWHPTPHSFPAAPGEHLLEIKLSGFQTEKVPVSVAATDMTVKVDMNRPVFEGGIALTVIGAVLAASGVIVMCVGAINARNVKEGDEDIKARMMMQGGVVGGVGILLAIPGVLMMILDGHDDAVISVTPVTAQ